MNYSGKDKSSSRLGFSRRLWVYTLSRERISKLKSMARCRQRGYVVLTDRFPQSEIPGDCDGARLFSEKGIAAITEAKMLKKAKLVPPDLVVKLIASPEVAMSRKPGELTLEMAKELNDKINKLHFSPYTEIVLIDADQTHDKVWLDIKNAIWNII